MSVNIKYKNFTKHDKLLKKWLSNFIYPLRASHSFIVLYGDIENCEGDATDRLSLGRLVHVATDETGEQHTITVQPANGLFLLKKGDSVIRRHSNDGEVSFSKEVVTKVTPLKVIIECNGKKEQYRKEHGEKVTSFSSDRLYTGIAVDGWIEMEYTNHLAQIEKEGDQDDKSDL